jgi:hypothetical protein
MATNGRDKGKRGELEVAALMKKFGFEARRGQQFKGTKDSPDVVHNMDGFAVEVKLREQFSMTDIYAALGKQQSEARPDEDAVVFYRRNRKPWIVVMDAERFLKLIAEEVFTDD